MNTEKETWINTVLDAGSALKDLEAPSQLDFKVLAAVRNVKTEQLVTTSRLRLGIAASVALVLLNAVILGMWKPVKVEKAEAELGSYNSNIYQSE